MSQHKYFSDGDELAVEKQIGKGGEGVVYSLVGRSDLALKVYRADNASKREQKIRAMIAADLASRAETIAFPKSAVKDNRGRFSGFLMQLVSGYQPLHELYAPASRRKHFPDVDYRFLVRTALNISRVVAQAHSSGCMIGDINHSGILISKDATVALIDADSFQFISDAGRFLCLVGVPEYTPPELQGIHLGSVVRSQDHDAFGLAVVIFQLLCMGRHPFSGRSKQGAEIPLEKSIKEYRFAYSKVADTGMLPPPGACTLEDFPIYIGYAFEAAFSRKNAANRPKPKDWVNVLLELEQSLRLCSTNKLHHYPAAAKECPWCRMEAALGGVLFQSATFKGPDIPKGKVDPQRGLVLDVQALLSSINSVPIPKTIELPLPKITSKSLSPSALAKATKWKLRLKPIERVLALGIIALAGWLLFALQINIIVAGAIGIAGAWLFYREIESANELLADCNNLSHKLVTRASELQNACPVDAAMNTKAGILDKIDEFKKLSQSFGSTVEEYDKKRRQAQFERHLDNHFIRSARINKVSGSDLASLASFGIETALDAKRRNLQQVFGIGPVKARNISSWAKNVENSFRFDANYSQNDRDAINRTKSEIVRKQLVLEGAFKGQLDILRSQARAIEGWKLKKDPELEQLAVLLEQAMYDLGYVGLAVPSYPKPTPRIVPAVTVFSNRSARSSTKRAASSMQYSGQPRTASSGVNPSCPTCGGRMVRRVARRGRYRGKQFWGCARYPACNGIVNS